MLLRDVRDLQAVFGVRGQVFVNPLGVRISEVRPVAAICRTIATRWIPRRASIDPARREQRMLTIVGKKAPPDVGQAIAKAAPVIRFVESQEIRKRTVAVAGIIVQQHVSREMVRVDIDRHARNTHAARIASQQGKVVRVCRARRARASKVPGLLPRV